MRPKPQPFPPTLTEAALIRRDHVELMLGIRRSLVFEGGSEGWLPKPIRLGRAALYPADEVQRVARAIKAGATKDDLKLLVANLHAQRSLEAAA